MIDSDRVRFPSLTSLRFIFALAVLTCHMTYISNIFREPFSRALQATVPFATIAVSGFFVLSGFVLTWSHRPGDSNLSFWRRRAWKIYPNHLLAWTVLVVLFTLTSIQPLAAPSGHGIGPAIIGSLLLQDWIPHVSWFLSYNQPAWSISCEMFFYATFPALLHVARAIPVRHLRSFWIATAVTIATLPLVSTAISGPQPFDWLPINEYSVWFIYVLPPIRLPEFFLGILTARMLLTHSWRSLGRIATYTPLIIGVLLLPALPAQYGLGSASSIFLAPIVARFAQNDLNDDTRRMNHRLLIKLGEASYALYITHFPLLIIARIILGTDRRFTIMTGLPITLALMTLAITVSVVVHRWYEEPLMRRWSRKRPPKIVTAGRPQMYWTPIRSKLRISHQVSGTPE